MKLFFGASSLELSLHSRCGKEDGRPAKGSPALPAHGQAHRAGRQQVGPCGPGGGQPTGRWPLIPPPNYYFFCQNGQCLVRWLGLRFCPFLSSDCFYWQTNCVVVNSIQLAIGLTGQTITVSFFNRVNCTPSVVKVTLLLPPRRSNWNDWLGLFVWTVTSRWICKL